MRKNTKQSLIDIVKTIYDAHDDIKKLLKKGYADNAASLIGDCQDAALSIGNTIIESEGEEFITVGLIENYCRDLFDVYNSINDSREYDINEVMKLLNKRLTDIKKSIEKDIIGKLEVVFMPYKASMWDSLESVWKAADEDPECDAYVVPVPYYDRNPDHSFGEFHYEGDQFPDYVPITHYMKYDERVRKPDVIYIHNPYDDCNYVTSVDPRFYSSELKKCTEKLVYIPYFVMNDSVSNHFCTLSACINADYVILQSKQEKNKYLEVYSESFGLKINECKNKFLALGNPKFDAVINLKNKEYILPYEWKKLIGDRKIILYNTSVSSILNGNEEYLNKIISVLQYFKKNDEVVLWWRPHPLSSAVYDSMRNELLGRYVEIVKWYKNSNFGIYDDTSNLHRAILYSDAYYGDRSSLVALYQLTGKPVMIQNTYIHEYNKEKEINLGFEDVYDDGKNLWFSAINFNGLFKMDKITFKAEFIGCFKDENVTKKRLFSGVAECDGKLYFSPFNANSIGVYDMCSGDFSNIEIEQKYIIDPYCKLYTVNKVNDKLYFVPYAYDAIVEYNTKTQKVNYLTEWKNIVRKNPDCPFYYFRKAAEYDGILYIPSCCDSVIVALDTQSNQFSLYASVTNDTLFHGIEIQNNIIYTVPMCGNIYSFDIINHTKYRFNYPSRTVIGEPALYSDVCFLHDYVLIFPYHADEILKIELKSNKVERINNDNTFNYKSHRLNEYDGKYIFAKKINEFIYTYNVELNVLIVFDGDLDKWSCHKISIIPEKFDYIIDKAFYNSDNKSSYVRADDTNCYEDIINIDDLIKYLKNNSCNKYYDICCERRAESRKNDILNSDGTSGTKIHKTIKEIVQNTFV